MVPFAIRQHYDDDNNFSKGIFIDGELFDWGIDEEDLREALAMGPDFFGGFQADIERHFLESISEFMGRRVTRDEVNQATVTGWIRK